MKRKAVYAGSFDPLTNGHLWMIEQGVRLFDELVVSIGINPAKRYSASLEDRLILLQEALRPFPNVQVTHFSQRYLVDYSQSIGAQYILRGIRKESDYEYERGMRYVNEDFDPAITTVFLIPPRLHAEVSSSFVKGLIGPLGWMPTVQQYVPQPVFVHLLKENLEARFQASWRQKTGQDPAAAKRVYQDLIQAYSEPHRRYHTLIHLADCFTNLDGIPELSDAARVDLELALWFHDVVYDPQCKDNERQSVDFFKKRAGDAPVTARIAGMILATETHQADDPETQWLLDLDLAILGSGPSAFAAFEQAIREEYRAYPDAEYLPGRRRILEGFYNREKIYRTAHFAKKYEARAKENIKTYLSKP